MRAFGLNIKSDIELNLPKDEGLIDVYIEKRDFDLPKCFKTKITRYDTIAYFAEKDEFYYLSWPNLANFKISKNQILYQPLSDLPDGLLRIFILSEAFGLLLLKRDYFLLHGSAVAFENHAEIFIGTPGAGKSTTIAAFAKNGFQILTDDLVAITFNNKGEPFVVPSFNEIKVWKDALLGLNWDYENVQPAWEGKEKYLFKTENWSSKNLPLKRISILKKPYSKYKKPLSPIHLPIEFIKYFPLAHQALEGNVTKKHFEQSLRIIEHVEVRILNRPKNFIELEKFVNTYQ
ncbi:hypothetical protein EGI22_20780 [Lacihabitans sp. LS3-19]|uniref:hypothetical protein n=1 Tax=Lacihabitans sp. LS3-19 TaxID=2487335 RepID=UPI0020CC8076|nr:hypothetical protein [Lacihabitans sp. LS3-19]MCP9770349.1 hypothetical protein [Lacihabitans sp. LS3-19]